MWSCVIQWNLLFYPEDGCSTFLQKIHNDLPDYTVISQKIAGLIWMLTECLKYREINVFTTAPAITLLSSGLKSRLNTCP
jgi:hypothetical protein